MTAILKAGRYEIVGELGRGAMGVVYKATDPVIGRAVAVKTIKLSAEGTGLSQQELLARFQTEARAAGLLTHPNIVVVFDAGEEDGIYYITMELVEGKSVQALIDAGQSFPLPRVLRIMEQTCSALQFAHERNVVHRDIKPANIMLTGDDTVKVTDFGTAKILQFGTVQQTAHVMGTPSYMSPEQVKGRAVDGRSDIFSLGVMLYEMITGEKPFPGQSITTVIYKIVNEEPVPPRQINPSIHQGISAAVMKALAKDPETRYQSCRELLEDLRNYRATANLGGSPQSTIALGGGNSPTATMAMSGPGLRGMHTEFATTTAAQSLAARTSSPNQTPGLRRTGPIAAYEAPKRKSIVGTIFAALLLLGVIGYGAYKLRPVYEDVRQTRVAQAAAAKETPIAPVETTPESSAAKIDANASIEQPTAAPPTTLDSKPKSSPAIVAAAPEAKPKSAPVAAGPTVAEVKSSEIVAEKPAPKKLEPLLSSKAAEFKQRVEEAIAQRGLTGKAKVQGIGNTLILAGKLNPSDHGGLLKLLGSAPAGVRVVDHVEDDDSRVIAPAAPASPVESGRPVVSVDRGGIHVVTNVAGAIALLHGPFGRVLNQCQTPCSFNNLPPARYSLEVKKDGYQSVQTALQVQADGISEQKIGLESLAKGLLVTSEPPGADVFINGAKQSGQTPVTLPLAPGQYNLVLRLQGFEAYSEPVQVTDNAQTQVSAKLNERSASKVAWAEVETDPKGADIWVDGTPTGKSTPSRIELPTGMHTVTLKMEGFQPIKRTVQLSEGGTITLTESLKPK
jgi:eukaryotic-like serine/threonine-protein kinase